MRIGMVSTYPPTVCGLATFTSALERSLKALGHRVDIVAVDDGIEPPDQAASLAVLTSGSALSTRRAAAQLSQCDVVVIQHEFGIFGGPDGEEVVDLVNLVSAPQVVVLHTVVSRPSTNQFRIIEALAASAQLLVVMSECARARLLAVHQDLDPERVVMIPHGAELAVRPVWAGLHRHNPSECRLLTWGLIGPGKGIEHVMHAVAELRGEGIPVRYTVAGMTHPKVFRAHGDRYRESLIELARDLGIETSVRFDTAYRGVREQTRFIASADAVVMAYDTTEQVTSGVLVDSIAAGTPVVATAFPHAVELLARGAGLIVRHGDHRGLVDALRRVATDERLRRTMTRAAGDIAPTLSWSAVADRYAAVSLSVAGSRATVTA